MGNIINYPESRYSPIDSKYLHNSTKENGLIYRQGHTENIKAIENPSDINDKYRNSVTLAQKAGFDGVELLAQG